jgi:hypothetical protein
MVASATWESITPFPKEGSNGQEQTDGKGIRHGEDFAGAKRSGTEFSPIDTRITVLGASSRFGRAPKALDWKKQEIAPQSGKSADHRRTSAPPTKDSLVRNAVGLRVDQTSTGNKRTDVKVFERPAVETTPRSTSRAGTGGVGAVSPDVPRRGLVPARGWRRQTAAASDQHGDEPFDHRRSRYGSSRLAQQRHWRRAEEPRGRHQRDQLPAQAPVSEP